MEDIPDQIGEDMDKQDAARPRTGGHRAHHIGFPLFDLSPCLNQLDDPQKQGGRHRHYHSEHAVAPGSNEDNQVGDRRNCGDRIQHSLQNQIFAVLSAAHEQADQRSQHGDCDRAHQDDPQCGPSAIEQAGQHTAPQVVRAKRELRTRG